MRDVVEPEKLWRQNDTTKRKVGTAIIDEEKAMASEAEREG